MFTLATDVQKIIMEFLEPQEIKIIYETCKDSKIMFDELTKNTNFIIECKRIILKKELKWFELKNIKLKLFETLIVDFGIQYWFKNGFQHRDNDLPAVIYTNGTKEWYKNGNYHRDNDLPAAILANGTQYWYKNGLRHRDYDLPAVIYANGDQVWYINGIIRRDNDFPEVIYADGRKQWYKKTV